ncbi:MAG: hypothetical protein RJB01_1394 [Actinomycetota bacterium]|jgi:hypothetical protein
MADMSAEDSKLLTLARGAASRIGASEGAAVRDEMGRSYASAAVVLGSRSFTALELAVAQAAASGARGLEAAVVVNAGDASDLDAGVVADLGGNGVPILLCTMAGDVRAELMS